MLNTDTKQLAGTILAQIVGGHCAAGMMPVMEQAEGLVDIAIKYATALEEAAKKAPRG